MSDVSAAIVKFSTDNNDEKANMTPAFISMNGTVCIRTLSTFICTFTRTLSRSSSCKLYFMTVPVHLRGFSTIS